MPAGRTFCRTPDASTLDITAERVTSVTIEGEDDGFVDADNDVAWGLYLDMRSSRPASLTIDPFGAAFGKAVSPNPNRP